MMKTEPQPDNITDMEDAATARWLTVKLAPARHRTLEGPGAEAVARMRSRILDEASQKRAGKIAA